VIPRSSAQLRRGPFLCRNSCEQAIRALLLAQEGSTTRLLQTLCRNDISVQVIDQQVVDKLPIALDGELPGTRFLRRLSSLHAGGHVLLDSFSYTALDVLPTLVASELIEGTRPIGHVFSHLWTRRTFRGGDADLLESLWAEVGDPDPPSSRTLFIHTPRAPCMLLAETFRGGVLAQLY